ncbi:MAG TPA: VOC family protein [Pseudomonadales bacterium]|jgi:PhnB protein|nr:VOC family protein [Pseudomonadales bacterium]
MKSAPEGWHTVTPRIVVSDVEQLIDFLRDTFGAAGEYRASMPSEMKIGDSTIMVSGAGVRDTVTAFLYVYVDDADATYQRALEAGAQSLEEPMDLPYGDRRGMVRDPWNNIWQIATRKETLSVDEIRTRLDESG